MSLTRQILLYLLVAPGRDVAVAAQWERSLSRYIQQETALLLVARHVERGDAHGVAAGIKPLI